jgi:hypothetical protein
MMTRFGFQLPLNVVTPPSACLGAFVVAHGCTDIDAVSH